MRILIAEDDVASRIALRGVLQKNGYQTVVTANGVEALQTLQQANAPRLAILDWMMPELDGLEVVRRIRSLATERPPYIILLTARDEKSDIIAGLEAGADDYLAKPFDPGELRARIEVGRRLVEMQDALHAHRELLHHQATHDPLTGLLNRRAILDRLHRELASLERQRGLLAVGMGDIDYFKRFNDVYGHQTGDDILCGIARLFQQVAGEHDTVGRIGGEEFLFVAPIASKEDHLRLFERLRACVQQTSISTKSGELACTLSIGVTCAMPGYSLDQVLESADQALYQAKNNGRNCVISQELPTRGKTTCVS
ncbi:MAG: diguanylate cyclase [Desulfobulbus sp.]|nr:diguanylate cyclase [Desulfobulbus sp.]